MCRSTGPGRPAVRSRPGDHRRLRRRHRNHRGGPRDRGSACGTTAGALRNGEAVTARPCHSTPDSADRGRELSVNPGSAFSVLDVNLSTAQQIPSTLPVLPPVEKWSATHRVVEVQASAAGPDPDRRREHQLPAGVRRSKLPAAQQLCIRLRERGRGGWYRRTLSGPVTLCYGLDNSSLGAGCHDDGLSAGVGGSRRFSRVRSGRVMMRRFQPFRFSLRDGQEVVASLHRSRGWSLPLHRSRGVVTSPQGSRGAAAGPQGSRGGHPVSNQEVWLRRALPRLRCWARCGC